MIDKVTIMHKPPRDYAEVATVEALAVTLASQAGFEEYWELMPRQKRNEFREQAYAMIEEALGFWESR